MNILELNETIWQWMQDGRAKATGQTLSKADVLQQVKMLLGKMLVAEYYDSRKQDEYLEADYSYYVQMLTRQVFALSDPNELGRRTVDMSSFQLYHLPKNKHIVNVTPIGSCNDDAVGQITMVAPGEENFYIYDPEMSHIAFAVVAGAGLDTYHVPPCVNKVEVQSTFNSDELDVALDTAFDIANQILSIAFGIPDFVGKNIDNPYSAPFKLSKRNLAASQPQETTV